MSEPMGGLWRGMRPLIGTVIGVGIFALPYVFAQAGFILAGLELLAIAVVSLLTFYLYGELLFVHQNHTHFVGVVSHELGPWGKFLASASYFGALWGAMLAYMVVGGEFVGNLLVPLTGWSHVNWSLLFFFLAALAIFGGPVIISRVQGALIPIFITLIIVLAALALPHIKTTELLTAYPARIGLPLDVILFAFSGFGALPEVRDVLVSRRRFRLAIAVAVTLLTLLFLLFTVAVVGLTGASTTPVAVEGLRFALKGLPFILVSSIGLLTVFTAFVTIGQSIHNTLFYDFRWRLFSAWFLAVGIPFFLYLAGARNFINIVGITGGFLGGISGIILLVAYERARHSVHLAKRSLTMPMAVTGLLFLVFVAMIVSTFIELTSLAG